MFLKLFRTEIGPTAVLGKLYVDNVAFCDTLEPAPAASKGATSSKDNVALRYGAPGCIAPGFYPVRLTMSPRFGEVLPLIDRVVGRSGIRIHPGNTAADTVGCILVGTLDTGAAASSLEANERLLSSRHAFMHLRARLERAMKDKEEIWIEIVDATEIIKRQDLYYDNATHHLYERLSDTTLRIVVPQKVIELMRLQGNWDVDPSWVERCNL